MADVGELVRCSNCSKPLPQFFLDNDDLLNCPACDVMIQVKAFPALLRATEGEASGRVLVQENEASCFYHPGKKAEVPCSSCGRFLCGLCDLEINGNHLCSSCITAVNKENILPAIDNRRMLYDDLAFKLAVFPLLIFWFTIFTAPVSLYVAIRYWNYPTSIIPRTKLRLVAAMLLSGIQVISWSAALIYIMS